MSEKHQDKTESEPIAIDNNIWIPPRLAKDRKKIERLQKKRFTQKIGLAGKTPLEIFQLLLLPVVLAASGYWYSFTQAQSSQRGHAIDIQIAVDQQRETLLKTCLDDIKDLLLNKRLRGSQAGDEVRVVARVEVLETLRHLDGGRKRLLILFLSEARLITMERNDVIIDLSNADLSQTNLSHVDMNGAHLSNADLSNADLSHTNLGRSDLSNANLSHTNLSNANLLQANLFQANLFQARLLNANVNGAHLSQANLFGANLRHANLSGADLSHANLSRSDLIHADLRGANLFGADLSHAILLYANLSHAILIHTGMSGAKLIYADLSYVDLRGARITRDQLNEVASLKEATMPDGSKHP